MTEPTMLEQLLAAIADAKAVIRAAHEAAKDLKQATREAREVGRDLQREEFEPYLRAEVARQVNALGEQTERVMAAAVARVSEKFDRLAELYLEGEGRDGVSLHDLAMAKQTIRLDAQQKARRKPANGTKEAW